MLRTDRWYWTEAKGEVMDEDGETVARVLSSSAADPQDGDGPIMAAGRDLLYALEGFVSACGGSPPDWLQAEYDAAVNAIEKARL